MTTILPRSRIIRVQFELALPADATTDEVLEWVTFNLEGGTMSSDSPLSPYDVEAIAEPHLTDTELHLHEKAERHAEGHWTIRRTRDPRPFAGEKAIDHAIQEHER
jgi:hypothetical protein